MGINYSIHYLTLYDAAHAGGHTAKHAAGRATCEIAPPLLAAYCTSIVGFFAVGFSSLQVLREFAVLGSFALAGAVITTLLLLPAILVLLDGRRHRRQLAAGLPAEALGTVGGAEKPSISPDQRALPRHARG